MSPATVSDAQLLASATGYCEAAERALRDTLESPGSLRGTRSLAVRKAGGILAAEISTMRCARSSPLAGSLRKAGLLVPEPRDPLFNAL